MSDIDTVLTRGVEQILPSKEALASLMAKKTITLYQGFDPSMPSLHLGHLTGLLKLRQFQKLGHKIIFLVGDFTGLIGDPTDKTAIRKKLTKEEVLKNYQNYKSQAAGIINFSGPNPAEFKFNANWNSKLTPEEILKLTSNFTVQQLIERDMFQARLKNKQPIYVHEFLYPIFQAYDSVVMNVDLEIGGNDQVFNMLAGRSLVKAIKGKEKFVLATKLLVDKGGNKVGKTSGNALFLDSTAEDFFAGIMSFPDENIALGFELLTEVSLEGMTEKIKQDPMGEKKRLAFEIVRFLWGESSAFKAQKAFENTFQKMGTPDDAPIVMLNEKSLPLLDLIFATKTISSRSEAKRLISQKAVEVGGKIILNPLEEIGIDKKGVIIKIGKKVFVKVFRG